MSKQLSHLLEKLSQLNCGKSLVSFKKEISRFILKDYVIRTKMFNSRNIILWYKISACEVLRI